MKLRNFFLTALSLLVAFVFSLGMSLASGQASTNNVNLLDTLTNFKDLFFEVLKIIGYIVAGFGALQFGLSFQSHDASQRSQGVMCIAGGIIVAAAGWIIGYIIA